MGDKVQGWNGSDAPLVTGENDCVRYNGCEYAVSASL